MEFDKGPFYATLYKGSWGIGASIIWGRWGGEVSVHLGPFNGRIQVDRDYL